MNYIIIPQASGDFISPLLLATTDAQVMHPEDLLATATKITEGDKIYIPSDTSFPIIRSQFNTITRELIDNLRNKYYFRKNLAELFPKFFFDKITLAELGNYQFDFTELTKIVIKPTIGFMAGGTRIIDRSSNLAATSQDITQELAKFSQLYPNLFTSEMLLEEYIAGDEEYAIDMYYDQNGLPVIINIYAHPFAKRHEYLQMLYYTNQQVFAHHYQTMLDFFTDFNKNKSIKNFPIHAEFKLTPAGKLIPIEFNCCRFGGMGLADLTYHAFGLQPYHAYFTNSKPDWQSIWQQRAKQNYCWLLCYNGADIDIKHTYPQHRKLIAMLPTSFTVLDYQQLDYQHSPGFGLVYGYTSQPDDLEKLLAIEFNDCFEKQLEE